MDGETILGHRARIGYTVAAVTTEIYPIDWYRIAADGVSLMMITLPLGERSQEDVEKCYQISIESAHTMARAGANLVLLGGLPINIAKGNDTVDTLMQNLESEIGVKMSCSALAQANAFSALGSEKVCIVHPFLEDQSPRHANHMNKVFGLESTGVFAGGSSLVDLGTLPPNRALEWGRAAVKANPGADTLYFACPHWTVIDAIQPLEEEFGINVMASLQAIAWEAMRKTDINDRVDGFGRLLKEF